MRPTIAYGVRDLVTANIAADIVRGIYGLPRLRGLVRKVHGELVARAMARHALVVALVTHIEVAIARGAVRVLAL